jgi:hypothetical protein
MIDTIMNNIYESVPFLLLLIVFCLYKLSKHLEHIHEDLRSEIDKIKNSL